MFVIKLIILFNLRIKSQVKVRHSISSTLSSLEVASCRSSSQEKLLRLVRSSISRDI